MTTKPSITTIRHNAPVRMNVVRFIKHFKKVMDGNSVKHDVIAKVVQGIDMDSDGIIDEVEFLE